MDVPHRTVLGRKSLVTARDCQKQNKKQKYQLKLSVQMSVKSGFRGTEAPWSSVAAFTMGQGWLGPLPFDRQKPRLMMCLEN